jgi:hypothetical protein
MAPYFNSKALKFQRYINPMVGFISGLYGAVSGLKCHKWQGGQGGTAFGYYDCRRPEMNLSTIHINFLGLLTKLRLFMGIKVLKSMCFVDYSSKKMNKKFYGATTNPISFVGYKI